MIGVFDSGIGGLSVLKELLKVIPNESFVYVADSGNCPYGPKSKEEIIKRSVSITKFLIQKGVKLIVIACNTATAASIDYLRANFNIPFVGMEPAIKPAILNSKSEVIGVLATKGTFSGELYHKTLLKYSKNATVLEQVGEGLVELVENGEENTIKAEKLLSKYIQPMLDKGADQIVLGCTHYPFLEGVIKKIVGKNVEIVNPAPAVAKRVQSILVESGENECDNAKSIFVTTGENMELVKSVVKNISPDKFSSYNFIKQEIK